MTARTVGQVVGAALVHIRRQRKFTQHEAARLCQAVGLNWTRVRVAAIERGDRETVDVGTLLLLAEAFDVAPVELFAGWGDVRLSGDACRSVADVRSALSSAVLVEVDQARTRAQLPPTEADQALAERLGVPPDVVAKVAADLWGQTLTGERDARVRAFGDLPPGRRQAHRGHITRELAREIESHLPVRSKGLP